MKFPVIALAAAICSAPLIHAAPTNSNTVVLTETGVKNLRIETVVAQETDFEESIFALGRIESIPSKHAAVSSRIPGRITDLTVSVADPVQAGQTVAKVESRQPGDPPPTIELKAPLSGLVIHTDTKLGDPVEPDKAILEIVDLTEVYAIAAVPEAQAAVLKPGSVAHIRVPALGDTPLEGEMIRFGTASDREGGTIDAVFKVDNKELRMRPGMRAEFSIVTGKRENVMSVPRAALQGEPSNRFLYVKHFDLANAFIKTPVEVGTMNDRAVEIVSGLFPADEVVTRGAYSLSFAGASSVSLKEALDAAHGHEHAEDGSELTPEKRAEAEAKKRAAAGLPPADGGSKGNPLWMYISGLLFILLLASLFMKRQPASAEDQEAVTESNPHAH